MYNNNNNSIISINMTLCKVREKFIFKYLILTYNSVIYIYLSGVGYAKFSF